MDDALTRQCGLTAFVTAFSTSFSISGVSNPIRKPTSASSVHILHSIIESKPDSVRHFLRANKVRTSERGWFRWVGGWDKSDCNERRRIAGGRGLKTFVQTDGSILCLLHGRSPSSVMLELIVGGDHVSFRVTTMWHVAFLIDAIRYRVNLIVRQFICCLPWLEATSTATIQEFSVSFA